MYRIEPYEGQHPGVQPRTEDRLVRWERVLVWDGDPDPEKKRLAGFVEVRELAVAGTRNLREVRYVYDERSRRIGFLSHEGGTHRYLPDGRADLLGHWEIPVGVRVLLGVPRKTSLGLEPDDAIHVPD